MNNTYIYFFILYLLLLCPSISLATQCPEGKKSHPSGLCCWPNQAVFLQKCSGRPQCPKDKQVYGTDCKTLKCPQQYSIDNGECLSISTQIFPHRIIHISAGKAKLGSNKAVDDEKPKHVVHFTQPYYIMKTEVTQGLWQSIMSTNPSASRHCGTNCPVEKISWYQTITFANKLSKAQNLEPCYEIDEQQVSWPKGIQCTGWRLPTEAEWEYAAQGGETFLFSGAPKISDVAWVVFNSQNRTQAVCKKQMNGFGLCDMTGNVAEWTWDYYGKYSTSSVTDPTGPKHGLERVRKGGSFLDLGIASRISFRGLYPPNAKSLTLGLRLVRRANSTTEEDSTTKQTP